MSCEFSNIVVSPSKLLFVTVEGSQFIPPYHYVRIERESFGRDPQWQLEATEDWVRYEPRSGTTPRNVRVGTSSVGMSVGTYKAKLVISSNVEVNIPYVEIELIVEPKHAEPDPEPVPPDPDPEPPGPDPDPDPDPEPPKPDPDPDPEPPDDNGEHDNPFLRLIQWIIDVLRRIGILRG